MAGPAGPPTTALLPTATDRQYVTLNCKPLMFEFPCKRRYINVKNVQTVSKEKSLPVRDLGWQSLENHRRNARLLLFYKGLHGLSAIPCNLLRRPLRNSQHSDSDTLTVLSSRVDSYMYSFFPRTISEWNKLSQDVRSKPSVASFRSALLNVPGPVEINFRVMALRQ